MARVSTDDWVAISDFFGRYCWFVDENKADEWAALWTEDGTFTGTSPNPIVGREALKSIPTSSWAQGAGAMRHAFANLYLDYGDTKDTVIAHLYNQVSHWQDGGKLFVMAICTATLVRNGDGWLIKRNDVVMRR
jgi:hypothetical protein